MEKAAESAMLSYEDRRCVDLWEGEATDLCLLCPSSLEAAM